MRLWRTAVSAAMMAMLVGCATPRAREPLVPTVPASRPAPGSTRWEPGRVQRARSLIGSRYRFGGETPRGFDCSGLVRYVLERDGFDVPRTASEQAQVGHWVALDELAAGDLVFFSEAGGKPHHVGLVVSRPGEALRMIHASTSQGVVETHVTQSAYWLRRLSFGRRIETSDSSPPGSEP